MVAFSGKYPASSQKVITTFPQPVKIINTPAGWTIGYIRDLRGGISCPKCGTIFPEGEDSPLFDEKCGIVYT